MSSGPASREGFRKTVKLLGGRLKDKLRSSSPQPPPASINQALQFSSSPPIASGTQTLAQPTAPLQPSKGTLQNAKDIGGVAWAGLETALRTLMEGSDMVMPLKSAVGGLLGCLDTLQAAAKGCEDYEELASDLTLLVNDLGKHLQDSKSAQMSDCVLNVVNGLERQIIHINQQRQRWGPRRYAEASQDIDDLITCYRRIEVLFRQLQNNAVLSIWSVVNEQLANTRLEALNPAKNARYNSAMATTVRRRECTPNTRLSVMAELRDWTNDPNVPKVYWMNGMAGTGKTTIACSLCAELEVAHRLAASFFCSRTLPDCREVSRIVPNIAYQLARFSYPFQAALCQALGNDPDIGSLGVMTQFQKLVNEPLLQVKDAIPADLVVMIDALDECSNRSDARMILDLLFRYVSKLPIKFFITCRPELGLLDRLQSQDDRTRSVLHLHDIEQSLVRADIQTYLNVELARLSLPVEQIKQLAERSGILFIYAATAIRYIQPEGLAVNSNKRLLIMLGANPGVHTRTHDELDALYATILTTALDDPRLEDFEKENIKQVLYTAICAKEPMSIEVITQLLQWDSQEEVLAALQPLQSVLHVSKEQGLVTLLHASFSDYMVNSKRSGRFFCDQTTQNRVLTQQCFNTMKRLLRFNICDLESSFMLDADVPDLPDRIDSAISQHLFYACYYWISHLEGAEKSERLRPSLDWFLTHQLLFWVEVMNLKQCINRSAPIVFKALSWLQRSGAPTDICRLAQDMWKLVTTFSANVVSRSTPHIYVSVLPFWPKNNPLWVRYANNLRGLINVQGPAIVNRPLGALAVWTATGLVTSVAVSSDGARVVSGSLDRIVCIWDIENGDPIAGKLEGHTAEVLSVAFSPDDAHVISGSADCTIRIWDAQNGDQVSKPFKGHKHAVSSVAFSHDGARIVSGSLDCCVLIWDVRSGDVVAGPLKGHEDTVSSVAFSPDGARVISGSDDHTIRLWDAQNGVMTRQFLGHTDWVRSVAFSFDGARIVSGARDHTVRIWDAETGGIAAGPFWGHRNAVGSVAFSSDGAYVVSGSHDCAVRVWNSQSGDLVAGPFEGHTGVVRSVAFLPNGTRVVSGSIDCTIRIWDAQSGCIAAESEIHTSSVTSVAFSPDGDRVASGSFDSVVRIWDSKSGNIVVEPCTGHTDVIKSVAFSPNGAYVASGSKDYTVRIWNARNGGLVTGPCKGHTFWVNSVAFSPNSSLVASASYDFTIRIWDVEKGDTVVGPLQGHRHIVTSVSFSPDGARVVSGSLDHTVRIWDAESGETVAGPFKGHTNMVRSVAFSPNGTHVASGSCDYTIRIWNAETGDIVAGPLEGHTDWVNSVMFSSDGAHIVSGSRDRTFCIWETHSGALVAGPFMGHSDSITSVAFSSDGTRVVSGSKDHTIRIWDIPDTSLVNSDTLDSWTMNDEGWILGQDSQLLLWVPPDLRIGLKWPQNTVVIYNRGSLLLDFDGVLLGPNWGQAYIY